MLSIGAADMGTGCDTILAQMAAEELECDVDNIVVFVQILMLLHMILVLMLLVQPMLLVWLQEK